MLDRFGTKERKILEYMRKYAHAKWVEINEFSGDISQEAVNLVCEIESDYDYDEDHNGNILTVPEFRNYVFPERVIELYSEYIDSL